MYRSILNSTPYSAVACAALCFCTIPSTLAQEFADQPEDQATYAGDDVSFTVEPRMGGLEFQWVRQLPGGYAELAGQTNCYLTFTNVSIADVGLYRCRVSQGEQSEYTRAASLYLFTCPPSRLLGKDSLSAESSSTYNALSLGGEIPMVIFGPVVPTSGSSGSCPGQYVGYANFTKTVAMGWGWAPSTNTTIHVASDNMRSDTKVLYSGKLLDSGCQQTSVTVPDPTYSAKYRFTIYFPSDLPTTNAYPITLTGFDP